MLRLQFVKQSFNSDDDFSPVVLKGVLSFWDNETNEQDTCLVEVKLTSIAFLPAPNASVLPRWMNDNKIYAQAKVLVDVYFHALSDQYAYVWVEK